MTYLLNLQMDLLYLITVDLPRSLLLDSENLTPSTTQYFMVFPTCMDLFILPSHVRTNTSLLYPTYTQKTRVFLVFRQFQNFRCQPSVLPQTCVTSDLSMSTYNKPYTIIYIQCDQQVLIGEPYCLIYTSMQLPEGVTF